MTHDECEMTNDEWTHPMCPFRPISLLRSALLLTFVILAFGIHPSASAHPADQSELRVRPKPHQLELRFTFNILTLTRFVSIDTDGDAKISLTELTAARPRIAAYLNQHVRIEINQQKATLGDAVRFESLWPDPEKTPPMNEFEYAARNVDVTYTQLIAGKRLEDFWLGFEIFEQTGPLQTIRGVFEQDGRVEEVLFSVQDPEYLYDTGYADDPFEKEADKLKAAKFAGQRPAAPVQTTELAARLATAPGASSTTTNASSDLAAQPSAALSATLESAPKAAQDNTQRLWMIRVVVLIIILVIGRKLHVSARTRIVSSRRRPKPR
jgi:hypothetical protein